MPALDRDYREWLKRAESDWRAVERIRGDDLLREISCFHTQQCIEKLLKGLLVYHSRDYPKTHDLVELAKLTRDLFPAIARFEPDLHRISLAYSFSRYPGKLNEIPASEAQQILSRGNEIRSQLRELFPL